MRRIIENTPIILAIYFGLLFHLSVLNDEADTHSVYGKLLFSGVISFSGLVVGFLIRELIRLTNGK
jgi:hypothetical protein